MSEEENIAIEILKEVASDDFDTLGDDISPKMAQNVLNVINNQQKEIERLDYELVREEQYTDVYKDLCDKQQKLINQLLEDMKERANNFSFESEIMWRKIEKTEKLLEKK